MASRRGLEEHPIVSKLVKDPSRIPDVTAISGYVGRSPKRGSLRLYSDLELYQYVDIRKADIVHSEEDTAARGVPGAVRLWVRSKSVLQYGAAAEKPRRIRAEFLDGELMGKVIADGGSLGMPLISTFGVVVPGALATTGTPCHCPTVSHSCTSKCLCPNLAARPEPEP